MRTRIEAGSSASHSQPNRKITAESWLRHPSWDTAAAKRGMVGYTAGDLVKVELRNKSTGEPEPMWVKVSRVDDKLRLIFGVLDNEPLANPDLRLGMEIAVSYDVILENMKPEAFDQ
jgi:uncharacterized protein YegJ (DUF2314 family)